MHKKIIRGILVGAAAFGIGLALYALHFFQALEWKSWDARLRLFSSPERASKDIVLVLVNQYSLDFYEKQLSLPWPWPREMYSYLIKYLKAGEAKACFFDIAMTESSRAGLDDDPALAQAMAEAGNILFPISLSTEDKESDQESEALLRGFALRNGALPVFRGSFQSVTLPLPIFLQASKGVGNIGVNPDSDGIYRRLPLLYSYKGLTLPSVPVAIANFIQGHPESARVPTDETGQMIIRFFGPTGTTYRTGTYRTYPIATLINSWAQIQEGKTAQIPPKEFAGKIVMVGLSAVGLQDLKSSPLSAVIPGTEIHAAALDTLLNRNFIRLPAKMILFALAFILALLAGVSVSLLHKIWRVTLIFLVCLAVPWAAACAAFVLGYWLEFVFPEFVVVLTMIGASVLNYSIEGKERRFIKSVFRHYLSPAVIDRIIENPKLLQLGGEKREITSFFSDVAGFTSLSEKMTPEEMVKLLNAYLSEMTDIILNAGGTLDKYEGDAIVAFWNAPLDEPGHALKACRAALECQKRLKELRPEFLKRYGHEITMRIGLNTGPAVVGNMGSSRRFDYTAMGDTINLAARLESACKQYQVSILAGEGTYERVKDILAARQADILRVVGKQIPVRVFQIIGEKDKLAPAEIEKIDFFHQGLEAYRNQEWERGIALFGKLTNDPLAAIYIDRCQNYRLNPPPEQWDKVYSLKVK
jgi:adenylate cyclase